MPRLIQNVRIAAVLCIVGALTVFALAGCTPERVVTADSDTVTEDPGTTGGASAGDSTDTATPDEPSAAKLAWLDTELTDAVTGESFRLSDFKGTKVLLHPFAAW